MKERLQKILSQWGVASRRQAEQMILNGRVRLNGTIVQLGQKADPEFDRVEVDGVPIQPINRPEQLYLLLHKPAGVLSTCKDPWQRITVLDLLPDDYRQEGLYPVGRLDIDTTGALLLTNDGKLTFCLTHPRHHVPKTYQVWVQGHPSESVLQAWRDGIPLSGRPTLPAQVRLLKQCFGTQAQTCLEVIIREGRNRQIRRVAEQLGYPVLQLHRTAIGPIQLQPENKPELPSGHCRPLMATELRFLRDLIDRLFDNGKYAS
jgi:23S rRNA pseudouridine2605 synthase